MSKPKEARIERKIVKALCIPCGDWTDHIKIRLILSTSDNFIIVCNSCGRVKAMWVEKLAKERTR